MKELEKQMQTSFYLFIYLLTHQLKTIIKIIRTKNKYNKKIRF
jgi:hypothetical protein